MKNELAWVRIGKIIREAREEKKLNQVDIARVINKKSITTISDYENGKKRIEFIDLKKICKLLDIDIAKL